MLGLVFILCLGNEVGCVIVDPFISSEPAYCITDSRYYTIGLTMVYHKNGMTGVMKQKIEKIQ